MNLSENEAMRPVLMRGNTSGLQSGSRGACQVARIVVASLRECCPIVLLLARCQGGARMLHVVLRCADAARVRDHWFQGHSLCLLWPRRLRHYLKGLQGLRFERERSTLP